jgi:hypothetical protein
VGEAKGDHPQMKGLPVDAEVAVDRIVKQKYAARFIRSGWIRPHMASLVKTFNEDMEHASQTGTIDPVTIASRYCHYFVNVHPFIDGNGRMCRLHIVSSVLLLLLLDLGHLTNLEEVAHHPIITIFNQLLNISPYSNMTISTESNITLIAAISSQLEA